MINFNKCRLMAHIIREVRYFQQVWYRFCPVKELQEGLLDGSFLLKMDAEQYKQSLAVEPRE